MKEFTTSKFQAVLEKHNIHTNLDPRFGQLTITAYNKDTIETDLRGVMVDLDLERQHPTDWFPGDPGNDGVDAYYIQTSDDYDWAQFIMVNFEENTIIVSG